MRFIIAGAGSIGSAIGGYLATAGYPVVLITSKRHANAVRKTGLILKSAAGELHPRLQATNDVSQLKWIDGDVIVMTSKSQHTKDLLLQLADAPSSIPVLCFQNGVRNEEWCAHHFENVYAGLVVISVTYVTAGVVEHTRNDVLAIGKFPSGLDEIATTIGEALIKAGFRVTLDEDVMPSKWGKMLLNLNNALYALIDTWLQLAYTDEELRHFLANTMREGLAVLEQLNIRSRMGPGEPGVEEFIETLASGGYAYTEAQGMPPARRTYPSTWQDVVLGRPSTEVDHFNGEIVRLGARADLPTPYNFVLLEMMNELTAKKAMPGMFNLQQVQKRVQEKIDAG